MVLAHMYENGMKSTILYGNTNLKFFIITIHEANK